MLAIRDETGREWGDGDPDDQVTDDRRQTHSSRQPTGRGGRQQEATKLRNDRCGQFHASYFTGDRQPANHSRAGV